MADDQHTKTYYVKNGGRDPDRTEEPQAPAASAPEPPPPPAPSPPPPPSQVEQDIKDAGLTPEEAARASRALAAENERQTSAGRGGVENLAVASRFRWLFLIILSLAATLTWAIEAQYAARPYHWPGWGLFLAAALLTIPTAKFLRLPTRAGLAALFWSATFFVSALYGPQDTIFKQIPAALPWAGLLTMIIFFTAVAVWRKVGRYKVIDLVLAVVLIYAALSPLWSLIDNLTAGGALALKFEILSASPAFITERLPWYLWPMTIMVLGVLPLAAFLALWDQFSALKRKGARHGGNLFLALAFLGLIPYGFLGFDQAVAAKPLWAQTFRAILPPAAPYARENGVEWSAPNGGAPIPNGPPEVLEAIPEAIPTDLSAPEDNGAASAADEAPAPAVEPTPAAPPQTSALIPAPEATAPDAAEPAAPTPQTGSADVSLLTLNAQLQATKQELQASKQDLSDALKRITELERKLDQLTGQRKPPSGPAPALPAPESGPEAVPPPERLWPESAPEIIPGPPDDGEASPYSSTDAGRTVSPAPGLKI